jgi:hypothetical protein
MPKTAKKKKQCSKKKFLEMQVEQSTGSDTPSGTRSLRILACEAGRVDEYSTVRIFFLYVSVSVFAKVGDASGGDGWWELWRTYEASPSVGPLRCILRLLICLLECGLVTKGG